ncbi:MAG: PqiC family protein [Proteobacteria bacterium]|nr:PqiC family protein [Pseudomonadota bacterium]
MNSRRLCPRFLCLCLAALCLFLLSACLTPVATTLHTLQPVRQQALARDFADFSGLILLMPVRLAPQLQGRALVSRLPDGTTHASTTHFWAGPLDEQIGQQLVSDLRDLLATDNIGLYPGPRFGRVAYQLEIEVNEFSSDGQAFTIVAVYTISDTATKTIITRKTFRQTRTIDQPDASGPVAGASQAIADLSKEAAAALLAAHRSQPAAR